VDLLHPAGPDPTMPFTGVRDDPNGCVRQLVSQRAVVSKTDHTAHQTDRRITAASEWEHQAAELMLVCCTHLSSLTGSSITLVASSIFEIRVLGPYCVQLLMERPAVVSSRADQTISRACGRP
jgi:hypothetical protein